MNNKLLALITFVIACSNVWSLPSTGANNLQTTAGVTTSTVGNTLSIAAPNRSVLVWQNFGSGTDTVAAGDIVSYSLPSTSSSVLNVVGGASNTRIDGSITSNGNVFILNPNGIILGQGSRVDVNSLVLSTSDNTAFASFHFQNTGKLPSQDNLTPAAGNITINGSTIGTKEGLHLYSKTADVASLISQGNLTVNADGSVFLGNGQSTYVAGNVAVNNPTGNTVVATGDGSFIVTENITVKTTTGSVTNASSANVNAKTLVVNSTSGDITLGKVNVPNVTLTGNNVSVAFGGGVNSTANVTANGTVSVTAPAFLNVSNLVNAGAGPNTVTAGGVLTLGDVKVASANATTFTASSIVDSKPGMSVFGPVSFNATGGNVSVTNANHSFGPVSVNAIGDATITESGALNLNRVTASKFTGKSDDFVFQTNATGTINAANVTITTPGSVTLNSTTNLFSNLTVSGGNVTVANTSAINLGNVTANGTLSVNAGTFITQLADTKVVATGATSLIGTTVTASNAGNQFGALTVDVGIGTAAITEDSTLNLASLRAGTAALKSLEDVITTGTASVAADNYNIIAGGNFTPAANFRAANSTIILAGKTADLGLLSLATNLNGKVPTVIAMTYKAPQP